MTTANKCMSNALEKCNWEAGIRTPIGGSRVRSPTVRRPPIILQGRPIQVRPFRQVDTLSGDVSHWQGKTSVANFERQRLREVLSAKCEVRCAEKDGRRNRRRWRRRSGSLTAETQRTQRRRREGRARRLSVSLSLRLLCVLCVSAVSEPLLRRHRLRFILPSLVVPHSYELLWSKWLSCGSARTRWQVRRLSTEGEM